MIYFVFEYLLKALVCFFENFHFEILLNLNPLFYENDINETINNLNKIYEDYKDKYNLKIKEELKLLKKEGKKEIEKINKDPNFMKLIKRVNENKLI